MKPIQIDGSEGEGGGQILRTTLSLASLLQQPVTIENIRAKRRRPGLMAQHLTCVKALGEICGAKLQGAELYSTRLSFIPKRVRGGIFHFDVQTAGSVCLVVAAILPPLLFAEKESEVVITGGTHVPMSPTYHFLTEVFLPALKKMGVQVELKLERWGWYPEGGGRVRLRVFPTRKINNFSWMERGKLLRLHCIFGISNLPFHIIEREQETIQEFLSAKRGLLYSTFEEGVADGCGNMIFLGAQYENTQAGFTALGRKGKPAERVAADLCNQWQDFSRAGAAIDIHLSDQILLYMVLAHGASAFVTETISSHLLANLHTISKFMQFHYELDEKTAALFVQGRSHNGC